MANPRTTGPTSTPFPFKARLRGNPEQSHPAAVRIVTFQPNLARWFAFANPEEPRPTIVDAL